MATHSSTLAWKIPWTEEPGRLQSVGLLGVGHDWATSLSLFTFMHWRRKWQRLQYSCWSIPGTGEPGGLPFMGSHRVGHDWSDLAATVGYSYVCMLKPSSLFLPSNLSTLVTLRLFSKPVSLFLFCYKFICIIFFRLHIQLISYGILFVWFTSLSMIISKYIHVAANGIISFLFMAEQYSFDVCTKSSLSIALSMDI